MPPRFAEKDLAFSIVWNVLRIIGGKASWSAVRLKSLSYAEEIYSKFGVDVSKFIPEVAEQFPRNKRTGEVLLPRRLSPPPRPEEIAKSMAAIVLKTKELPEDVVETLQKYQNLTDKMLSADDFLEKWKSSPPEILKELGESTSRKFISKYVGAPAVFEFIVGKALCALFQIPLYVEYNATFTPRAEKCVIWRGDQDNYVPKVHAPGEASDILVCARGPYYLAVEATLRFSSRQWKDEIEPIFRHTKEFIEKNDLDTEDVFLVFVVAQELLEDTYEWLHARSEDFRVVAMNAESLLNLVKASLFTFSLTHAEIRRLLNGLYERLRSDDQVSVYLSDMKRIVSDWCKSLLEPNLEVFIAVKAYELLSKQKGLIGTVDVAKALVDKGEVRDYLLLIEKRPEDLRKKTHEWVHQLSVLGLAREINGHLKALPMDEFEAKILKTYKSVVKIERD